MDYIYDEIKQRDTEFIKIQDNSRLHKYDKSYISYYKFDDELHNFITISWEFRVIYRRLHNIITKPTQFEIYKSIEKTELIIKSICDIFYNFCTNYLLNGFAHTADYIVFTISTEFNGNFCYNNSHQYAECLAVYGPEKVLTINNVGDLDKYYNIIMINQTQSTRIFLKLKN
jgi:hypothetical protein